MVNIARIRAEYRCWETSQLCLQTEHQCQKKASLIICIYFSFSTEYTAVLFFFTPNPVKLFLRDNQCVHTSLLQLINETPLILLLSAFFICLVCLLCLILACPLLLFLSVSSSFSNWGSPSFCKWWPKQHKDFDTKTEVWFRLNLNSAFKVHRVWSISTCLIVQHHTVIANTSAGLLRAFCHWLPPYIHTYTHTHMGLIWHLKTLY